MNNLIEKITIYLKNYIAFRIGVDLREFTFQDETFRKRVESFKLRRSYLNLRVMGHVKVHSPTGQVFVSINETKNVFVRESYTWPAVHASLARGKVNTKPKYLNLGNHFMVIPFQQNFYHFVIDEFPYILDYFNSVKNPKFITNGRLSDFQREFLSLMKIETTNTPKWFISSGVVVPISRLNSGKPNMKIVSIVKKFKLEYIKFEKLPKISIYISRRFSSRSIPKEFEIEKLMQKLGVMVVHLENLPLVDQIILFHSASLVIAPHGAGLTNLIWSSHGTKVIEIMPNIFFNGCYEFLCKLLNLNYEQLDYDNKNLYELEFWKNIIKN